MNGSLQFINGSSSFCRDVGQKNNFVAFCCNLSNVCMQTIAYCQVLSCNLAVVMRNLQKNLVI